MTVIDLHSKSRAWVVSEVIFAFATLLLAFALPLQIPILALPCGIVSFIRVRKMNNRLNWLLFTLYVSALAVSATIDLMLIAVGHHSIVGPLG